MRAFLFTTFLLVFLPTVSANLLPRLPKLAPLPRFPVNRHAQQTIPTIPSTRTSFPVDGNAPAKPAIPSTRTSFPVDGNALEKPSLDDDGTLPGGRDHHINTRAYFGYVPPTNDMSFTNLKELAEEFLHAHNWIRRQYNLPPYTWDEKLASYARGYLMKRYEDCRLVHSNSMYGENLFWGKKLHWSPSDATYYWYQEKQWFNFKTLSCAPPPKLCGHFTQMVWRDSQRIGCALQHCHNRNLGMLIVCEYDPAGNYEHENPLQKHE